MAQLLHRNAICVLFAWLMLLLSGCSLFAPSNPPLLVYFQERSAQLDAPARSVITLAARRAGEEPAAPVDVIGYTDSAGSPPADVVLSQQRAQAVADALVASGVAANRLVRTGRGQTGTDPGIASRRVEITIGGS
jgi:outer membrane protein OmpA-like peptidoglycan-associated protein